MKKRSWRMMGKRRGELEQDIRVGAVSRSIAGSLHFLLDLSQALSPQIHVIHTTHIHLTCIPKAYHICTVYVLCVPCVYSVYLCVQCITTLCTCDYHVSLSNNIVHQACTKCTLCVHYVYATSAIYVHPYNRFYHIYYAYLTCMMYIARMHYICAMCAAYVYNKYEPYIDDVYSM